MSDFLQEKRDKLGDAYSFLEQEEVISLAHQVTFSVSEQERISSFSKCLVGQMNGYLEAHLMPVSLLEHYALHTPEGRSIMAIVEAVLRIPDAQTVVSLMRSELLNKEWRFPSSPFHGTKFAVFDFLIRQTQFWIFRIQKLPLSSRFVFENILFYGARFFLQFMSRSFIMAPTIESALRRALSFPSWLYSFDILGEAVFTDDDALRYWQDYRHAISSVSSSLQGADVFSCHSISIKMSALHSRFHEAKRSRLMRELYPRLFDLAYLAQKHSVSLTLDAEEMERTEISLDLFSALLEDSRLKKWQGLCFVVQAYQKKAFSMIDYIIQLARQKGKRVGIRLVKGAYWDYEVKKAQQMVTKGYGVFTRKRHTDVSYLACAQLLMKNQDVVYPQWATHNPLTFSQIMVMAERLGVDDFEYQFLHGMGEPLYHGLPSVWTHKKLPRIRVYGPIGPSRDLLPYLVRRFLEGGASSSILPQLSSFSHLTGKEDWHFVDPVQKTLDQKGLPLEELPLPPSLMSPRSSPCGLDFSDVSDTDAFYKEIQEYKEVFCVQTACYDHSSLFQKGVALRREIYSPAQLDYLLGYCEDASPEMLQHAFSLAQKSFPRWAALPIAERAACLEQAADLIEKDKKRLVFLCVHEAGKTVPSSVAEWQEAIDFCRYYAQMAREDKHLQSRSPSGVVAAISPWNFPLAIFVGQIAAALVMGNAVLAKPAEQTPLVARRVVDLFYQAGFPRDVLFYFPGDGFIGQALVELTPLAGVAFTGSFPVARSIYNQIVPSSNSCFLVAETGGLNVMIADSSALAEQVVQDAVISAFDSAGQRCSALRILCVQDNVADNIFRMLRGHVKEWDVFHPAEYISDLGPIIDADACRRLHEYVSFCQNQKGWVVDQIDVLPLSYKGHYFPPTVIEVKSIDDVQQEVFGPILHLLRWKTEELPLLIEKINAKGYGLTFGVHSRIQTFIDSLVSSIHVGNIYINRDMIGAVVGRQPFGGCGLSGTGPKAGGPLYLYRFTRPLIHEKAVDPHILERYADKRLYFLYQWCQENLFWGETEEFWLRLLTALYDWRSFVRSESLSSPFGETNQWSSFFRSPIMLAFGSCHALCAQLMTVLSLGAKAVLWNPDGISSLIPTFPVEFVDFLSFSSSLQGAGVILLSDKHALYSTVLSYVMDSQGPLIPIIHESQGYYDPVMLFSELTVTNNLSVVGGVADLVMLDSTAQLEVC